MNRASKRNKRIVNLYKRGKTFQEIANLFKFTRSRSDQIILSQTEKEIIKNLNLGSHVFTGEEKELLRFAARDILKKIRRRRSKIRQEEIKNKIKNKIESQPGPKFFYSGEDYAKALGVDGIVLKKYFPEIVKQISIERRKKWSRHYNCCRNCGTTTIRHRGHGLCEKCYYKSNYHKENQEAYRLRNLDKIRKRQKEYHRSYNKRFKVIEKNRKYWDSKYFNGNREKAMQRDSYKCRFCGMTQRESYDELGRDLYVSHIDDIRNNSLENLITLCQKCHNRILIKIMRGKVSRG